MRVGLPFESGISISLASENLDRDAQPRFARHRWIGTRLVHSGAQYARSAEWKNTDPNFWESPTGMSLHCQPRLHSQIGRSLLRLWLVRTDRSPFWESPDYFGLVKNDPTLLVKSHPAPGVTRPRVYQWAKGRLPVGKPGRSFNAGWGCSDSKISISCNSLNSPIALRNRFAAVFRLPWRDNSESSPLKIH